MKKIAILLALLALCLCIVPCCAEEADDSIVMGQDILLISPAPDAAAPVDGEPAKDTMDAPVYAEDVTTTGTVIGGADGPTAILVAESDSAIEFHPENFMSSLSYMGTGMIGIFIVIGLIVLATVLLNKLFSDKAKKDE